MIQRTPPQRITILAFDDNDELDVIGPYEILRTAARLLSEADQPAPEVMIASVKGMVAANDVVHGINGLSFGTTPWESLPQPDVLIVAGGGWGSEPPVGIAKFQSYAPFTTAIRSHLSAGRQVMSVCTGAFGLVGAGVVSGRRMTTHPVAVDALAKAGAIVLNPDSDARVVDDGDIISCGGVTSGTDEMLYFLEAFWPQRPSLASDVRSYIDYNFVANVARLPTSR